MSTDRVDAESKVSGNQANIPTRIRRRLDIDDGDRLQWSVEDDRSVRVEVVHRSSGSFADFTGYDGEDETDSATNHDAWGVE
ncbi:AbrB/MazE/SpoVT family DNA-binding domain-containing protein [Haloterrigena alkaliphila]|uniref:AbrB/MazE/SpoVT family DNA-binding domain-containing protein n=1 Tax=Haloterrigena alkaliphila TaxID=2816475 RepID=A0A8A2VA92_9EURY|nr:AbrB/MazE/SpoVT family DNA-binding domain-containing protein [Haloterrigena alkaliphila]QSW98401.1 AbrB/MazE/SpoVT family DNA-binding domain-containing protein [Haloterrigena alkaliphila]